MQGGKMGGWVRYMLSENVETGRVVGGGADRMIICRKVAHHILNHLVWFDQPCFVVVPVQNWVDNVIDAAAGLGPRVQAAFIVEVVRDELD